MANEYVQRWAFPTDPFGEPSLIAANNADTVWSRGFTNSTFQKSSTGWLANLYGGAQTNDDWAAVYIPVNEMKLASFASAKWTYFMTSSQTMGVNIVIWAHDPSDLDKRAEITQVGGHADLEKGAGWNAFEFKNSTGGMFYYGENVSGSGLTAGTQYTWVEFIQDVVFSTWKIYRISIEYGWEAAGTFNDVWVGEIILDGKTIPLKPDSGGSGRIGHRFYTVTTGAVANTLAPKTPFRLLSADLEINTAGTTDESLTITKDSGNSAAFDTLLLTQNTKTPAVTSLFIPFGETYDFAAWDEIDLVWPNTENRTLGFTWTYQTVF